MIAYELAEWAPSSRMAQEHTHLERPELLQFVTAIVVLGQGKLEVCLPNHAPLQLQALANQIDSQKG